MWETILTKWTYKFYAISRFNNGNGTWTEFFFYLRQLSKIGIKLNKKTFSAVTVKKNVNLLIELGNKFQSDSLARLLFYFNLKHKEYSNIKTYLYYINRLPDFIYEVDLDKIEINEELLKILKSL